MSGRLRSPSRPTVRTAVIILALLGVTIAAWCYRGHSLPLSGTRAGVDGRTVGRGPDGPLRMIEPPGMTEYQGVITRFREIDPIAVLTDQEMRVYRAAGASTTRVGVGRLNHASVVLVEVRLPDAAAAVRTKHRMVELQHTMGLTATAPGPRGVATTATPHRTAKEGFWLMRGHYVHGSVLVRIMVWGEYHHVVLDAYTDTARAQTRLLEPDAQRQ